MSEGNGKVEAPTPVYSEHEEPREVIIKGDDGTPRKYTVREMDGPSLDAYTNWITRRTSRSKQDLSGVHEQLISRCLYDAEGRKVPMDVIRRWGARIKNLIMKECREANGMTDEVEVEEKND